MIHEQLAVQASDRARRHQGKVLGWIAIFLLTEACVEQFFPGDSVVKVHSIFFVKDVLQSLAAAVLASQAARLTSRMWLSLVMLGLLNAVLTVSAGMSLGPDDFLQFLHSLYPEPAKPERIHRTRI